MPELLCKILKIPVMYTCSDLSIREKENVPERKQMEFSPDETAF